MFLIAAACPARRCEAARTSTSVLFNPRLLMRAMFGKETPREAASTRSAILFVIQNDSALAIAVISAIDGEAAMLVIVIDPDAA